LVLIVVTPAIQLVSLTAGGEPADLGLDPSTALLPADLLASPTALFIRFLFPVFLSLGGLAVPSTLATYTVVGERERRSLELLVALPLRVGDILISKLLATFLVAGAVVLPLFALDAIVLLGRGLAGWAEVAQLLLVLLGALCCSVGQALLLALLARDLRTAQNLNGALLMPSATIAAAVLLGAPPAVRLVGVAFALAAAGAVCAVIGLRWLTFERYLM
jgi:ABC-2 type transport system permease protein